MIDNEVQPIVETFTMERGRSINLQATITIYKNSPPVAVGRVLDTHDVIIRFWNEYANDFSDTGIELINVVGSIEDVRQQARRCWGEIADVVDRASRYQHQIGIEYILRAINVSLDKRF